MHVVFATPTRDRPHPAYLASLEACLPAVEAAGFTHSCVFEVGCPYISAARARMLGKSLRAGFDQIVFLDDDVSWEPQDMVKLLTTEGDVVGGTYRFKQDDEKYMALLHTDDEHKPVLRDDGCISASRVPAGFLRVSYRAVWRYMAGYPDCICYADKPPTVDLFNHGAHAGQWWGEDYALSRRWRALGGDVWLIPDLNLTHNGADKAYPGNFHKFLLRQPGGSEE